VLHRKKRGGRKPGSKNKRTIEREKAVATITASGADPVTFFSGLLKNKDAPLDLRFQAAKELAPYGQPKLTSIEARSGGMGHEEWLEKSTWSLVFYFAPKSADFPTFAPLDAQSAPEI
jgi:hypothetical protein